MFRILAAAVVALGLFGFIVGHIDYSDSDITSAEKWAFGFCIGVFLILVFWWRKKKKLKKFCAWCGDESGLKLEKEYEGKYEWAYPNKDGSEDKRKRNNFQLANYFTIWKCKKCSAVTMLKHQRSQSPSKEGTVDQLTLVENGKGKRTAKDWKGVGMSI